MRTMLVVLTLFLGSVFCFTGCQKKPGRDVPSYAQRVLGGEHQLRRMTEITEVNGQVSGGFFLFVGGISGSISTDVSVKFAWQMNDSTYAISSLPLEKIRVKLDESTLTPTIRFRWVPRCEGETQELMATCVRYALITAKPSDWPVQVQLPLTQ